MSASPSPIVRLLAWVTVSAFLLTAAPGARQLAGPQGRQQWAPAIDELAHVLAPVGPGLPQGFSPLPLSKVRDVVAAPDGGCLVAPNFLRPAQLKSGRARPAVVPRLSLVGLVELRI